MKKKTTIKSKKVLDVQGTIASMYQHMFYVYCGVQEAAMMTQSFMKTLILISKQIEKDFKNKSKIVE